MLKKVLISLWFALSSLVTFGQIFDPVEWSFDVNRISATKAELIVKAEIEDVWHLYSQFLPRDDGPIATSFNFDASDDYKLIGKVEEEGAITAYDSVNMMELSFFEHKAIFKQEIEVLNPGDFAVSGYLEFMVCNDVRCLPPETVDFKFALAQAVEKEESNSGEPEVVLIDASSEGGDFGASGEGILDPVAWDFKIDSISDKEYKVLLSAKIDKGWHLYSQVLPSDEGPLPTLFVFDETEGVKLKGKVEENGEMITDYDPNFEMDLNYFKDEVTFEQLVEVDENIAAIKGSLEYMVCDERMCLPPELVEFSIDIPGREGQGSSEASSGGSKLTELSFWGTFIKGFIGGLLALLTPCVFPMIPLTVSFFTKQSKTKAKGISNAILYAASIIGIYVLLGFGVTTIFGADALNALSTNVWFNLAFFVLLVVFAISFFGAFEITLPASWINKADTASDKGGLIGIFFMAFTLSLVSFSCTGPIIGTLLVDAAVNGGVAGPLVGMFGFSFALALPFGLFAAFPGWMNSLPKSGGWLNVVKVVLGFLELAFAFKFLSNADLVVQAGLLKRELFLAIWIGIFLLLSLYLLGVFRMAHDSPVESLTVTRLMFATVSLIFTIYLIPGLWGAPLKIISGFPPPMFYSESPNGIGGGGGAINTVLDESGEVVGEPEHCPHNLPCFHDYDEGLAHAKKVGKPVMIDFTGWACVNCRKMEDQVWSDPRVLKRLRDDFVLISLYVDEKLALPEEEQIEVTIGNKTKKLRTVGNKWSYFQASKYGNNSQPYYVIIDHDEKTMNGSAAYDPDIEKFINWLDEGRGKFDAGH